MSGQSSQTTDSYTNAHQVSGPEQWMKDQGAALYQSAATKMPDAYTPYSGERVADYGSNWTDAQSLIKSLSGSSPDLATARSVLSSLISSPANDPNKSVSDYVNPYVGGVLAPTLRNLAEARQTATNQTGLSATMSGAFGDAQQGVANSLTNRDYMNNVSDATSKAYSDAFDKGLAQQNTVMSRLMQIPGMAEQLGQATDARTVQAASGLDTLAQQDQQLRQAKDNVGFSDWNTAQNWGLTKSSQLMDLLNATPHDTTSDTQSHTWGKTQKDDNSGLQALGSLATKALGGLFGGGGGAGLGSTLLGALL